MQHVIVQRVSSISKTPSSNQLKQWASQVLQEKIDNAELTIRIVDKAEIQNLNSTYRKKNKPTNVLSFPFELPPDVKMEVNILGDVVICAEVISEEAAAQGKALNAHWAHMIVHGILHLLGYDHEKPSDAHKMETEEIQILKKLGFDDPYTIQEK